MLGVFADAARVLFNDANMSVAAGYTPAGASASILLRVIPVSPELDTEVGGDRIRNSGGVFSVLQADLPDRPGEGDMIVVGGASWRVFDAGRDPIGFAWRVSCESA